jgi:hypothetical protein
MGRITSPTDPYTSIAEAKIEPARQMPASFILRGEKSDSTAASALECSFIGCAPGEGCDYTVV